MAARIPMSTATLHKELSDGLRRVYGSYEACPQFDVILIDRATESTKHMPRSGLRCLRNSVMLSTMCRPFASGTSWSFCSDRLRPNSNKHVLNLKVSCRVAGFACLSSSTSNIRSCTFEKIVRSKMRFLRFFK